jgi:hypothetical protein
VSKTVTVEIVRTLRRPCWKGAFSVHKRKRVFAKLLEASPVHFLKSVYLTIIGTNPIFLWDLP